MGFRISGLDVFFFHCKLKPFSFKSSFPFLPPSLTFSLSRSGSLFEGGMGSEPMLRERRFFSFPTQVLSFLWGDNKPKFQVWNGQFSRFLIIFSKIVMSNALSALGSQSSNIWLSDALFSFLWNCLWGVQNDLKEVKPQFYSPLFTIVFPPKVFAGNEKKWFSKHRLRAHSVKRSSGPSRLVKSSTSARIHALPSELYRA